MNSAGVRMEVRWNFLSGKCRMLPVIRKSALDSKAHSKKVLGCETILWVNLYPEARYSQKSSHRALRMQHLKAIMGLAPLTVQCMPDCLSGCPITQRQPASTTPEPMKRPCFLNAAYRILSLFFSK